jgi:uncharacterized protein YbjQ (UPF0145 family)|nr:MAG TPA: hypothetical protein [Bacteriophage sp.]
MLISTTDILQGVEIAEYKGIVAARVASAKSATLKGTFEKSTAATMESLSNALVENAKSMGADAIIGVRVIPEAMTTFATGTAVKLK